jgi:AcrR family transcriptional regulator
MKQQTQAVSKRAPDARPNAGPDARIDARVERTRTGIDLAFVQLLAHRSYRSLTVQDIARKADVGRATFYAHFESKDELLRSQFIRFVLPLVKARPEMPYLLDCTALFEHVLGSPQRFRNIMSGGEGSGGRVIRAALEEHVRGMLASRGSAGANEVPQELLARFVVSTLLAVMIHALQSKAAEPPQQLQNRFARLAGSGLTETN